MLLDSATYDKSLTYRYASSFCFSGDYVDKKEMDSLGRRMISTELKLLDKQHRREQNIVGSRKTGNYQQK